MEPNALPGGVYSNVPPSMLGLEMSLHHQLQPQNQQNPHHLSQPHHPMASYAHPDGGDYHLQPQQSAKHGYPSAAKSKNQSLTLSDDDEPGLAAENSADDGKRKMSPWQRMKWTDNMVRLLIMVVYYIGDEAGSEANDPGGKKKGGGVLQKKGKWKSVSRAMMERGFYVSPQQCEDKFNDLNKRYKRVNDILGKGTSCRVVENQSLLDTMDHLSPKMKEEVKKLLNSKHLFFREMCAYHNSCSHGGGNGSAQPEAAVEPPQGQRCSHSTTEKVPTMSEGSKLGKGASGDEEDDYNNDDEDDDDDNEDEEEDDDGDDDDTSNVNEVDERSSRKRMRKGTHNSPLIQQLEGEMMGMMRDGTKSVSEKKQWMRMKMMMLEEQHVGIQAQTFELEKQRLKWLKFSSKKEREMERERLRNERMKLENERMVLLVKQKELDLMDLHKQGHLRGDPSSVTG